MALALATLGTEISQGYVFSQRPLSWGRSLMTSFAQFQCLNDNGEVTMFERLRAFSSHDLYEVVQKPRVVMQLIFNEVAGKCLVKRGDPIERNRRGNSISPLAITFRLALRDETNHLRRGASPNREEFRRLRRELYQFVQERRVS
jgi:hypothetical protein